MDTEISLYNALTRMHELTDAGIPFSIEFVKKDGQIKKVKTAMLRSGYRSDFTDRAKFLVAYTDMNTGESRQFNRALLMKFNKIPIKR